MDPALTAFLAIFGGFLAGSGGFWVYLRRKYEKKDAIDQLIMGLAHDKIVFLGLKAIEKGFITKDEYDDLFKYFWEPYKALGGDGSAERIIKIVELLPLRPDRRQRTEVRNIVDKLHEGSENVMDKLDNGEDDFGRHKE